VEGGVEGTGVSGEEILTIAADETAEILTVKATSTVDASKSGEATVTVYARSGGTSPRSPASP
jgi:hypothetical protein